MSQIDDELMEQYEEFVGAYTHLDHAVEEVVNKLRERSKNSSLQINDPVLRQAVIQMAQLAATASALERDHEKSQKLLKLVAHSRWIFLAAQAAGQQDRIEALSWYMCSLGTEDATQIKNDECAANSYVITVLERAEKALSALVAEIFKKGP